MSVNPVPLMNIMHNNKTSPGIKLQEDPSLTMNMFHTSPNNLDDSLDI